MFQLRPFQHQLKTELYASWDAGSEATIGVAPTGAGKCLAAGTEILMADGHVKLVEHICVGDKLASPTGGYRTVLSVAQGQEEMYRVTPTKGDPYVVNASHILSLRKTNCNHGLNLPDGRNIPMDVDHVTMRADHFHIASKTAKHVLKGWRSPVQQFTDGDQNLEVPPYLLGIWIGDGTKLDGRVSLTKPKGCDVRVDHSSSGCPVWHLKHHEWQVNPALKALRNADAFDSWPSIPHAFKTASLSDRAELLAGILDTDGSVSGGGWDIIFKHEVTAKDVAFVARSIGLAAYVSTSVKTIKKLGFEGVYHRVSISGDASLVPCKVKVPAPRKINKDPLVVGIVTESIGVGDYYGFELDGDRLFMLGDFTVTHNTVIMSSISTDVNEPACLIAHRQELVQQISMALARAGLRHNIIAAEKTIKVIISQHIREFGTSFYDRRAHLTVAGVDTLIARAKSLVQWANTVRIWMIDECHHALPNNKWGRAIKMFQRAKGVGFTASPVRSDRKSLAKSQGGVFTDMRVGPSMRQLIDQGYLCDYRIFGPPQSINVEDLKVGSTGDFTRGSLHAAAEQSTITGDIVEHYLKIARGKRGITFTVDVEAATKTAQLFQEAGVPAEAVSAKTPDTVRNEVIRKFQNGSILQLVNVDLFGEGFDVPAVEVVSMGRPTQSLGLFIQQFGRALRTMDGKSHGIIIDHVGNVKRHGLPDAVRGWKLENDESGRRSVIKDPDVMPVTTCVSCFMAFEAVTKVCPYCGHVHEPESRGEPKFVDGDLIEFGPELLAELRAAAAAVDGDPARLPSHLVGTPAEGAHYRRHGEKQLAQTQLRETIALWAGVRRDKGMGDSEVYRRFFHTFGVDVLSAQSLGKADAEALNARIVERYWI